MNFDNYSVNINQVGPIQFKVEITTPDKLKFINTFQANPAAINKDNLINHLIGKDTRKEWVLDLPPENVAVEKTK